MKLGIVEGKLIASPLERGAGSLKSLVLADGFCVIPQKKEGILAHEKVNVRLMQPMDEIDHTLVVIGSHDLILDVINDQMVQSHEKLSSTHVGSFNGLLALRKKEAHLAPSHLLDEKTGIYNQSIVKELFSNEKMVIIKGVHRQQGLIVKKGNPKKIHGISDLQNNIAYINRQKGSGTRNLLDYLLSQNEIAPHQINGYDHEVTTHMAVAIAVSEDVDVGMGVYSASQALNLDFIECACEDYDFVTYASYLEHPMIQSFIQILKSKAFHDQLDRLGGYGYEESGEVIEL